MITVVVGGLFGSEGKGLIVGHIAGGYLVHVRVGAANAGHTVYVDGHKHVLQQLPCAAYANPFATLVLGAGAMISPDILVREIKDNLIWRAANEHPVLNLIIDKRAHAVSEWHVQKEQLSGLAERIGSTSAVAREGIGAAQAARVMRTDYLLAREDSRLDGLSVRWEDTVELLHDSQSLDTHVLLEGTQGTGLSNTTGFYPYVTSRNVTASGIAADCGLGPKDIDSIIVVARTYPIRVAGPSGPFWPDSRELGWEEVGIDPEAERTTVTKKVRRVATFSYEQMRHAVRVNSATEIALTFADYLAPEIRGQSGAAKAELLAGFDRVGPMIERIERETFTPVTMVGTGPDTVIDRDSASRREIGSVGWGT